MSLRLTLQDEIPVVGGSGRGPVDVGTLRGCALSRVERLDTIPRISRRVAEVVMVEIGSDMAAFPSDRHLP